MKYLKYLFIVSMISSIALNSHAESEKSLTDILNSSTDFAISAAQSDKSLNSIPEFSNDKVREAEQSLGSIQVDDKADNLKIQGEQERNRQINSNPNGITATMAEATDISRVTGDNCPGCSKLVEDDLFVRSDKLMKDPIGQFELLKSEGCKEIENKKRKGFYRSENIEEVTDEIEELRICEAPTLQFNNCHKTLSVKCKQVIPCDYGGITKGSVSPGITFDIGKGFFTVGTDCDNCFSGTCTTFNTTAIFHLAKAEVITVFKLVQVKFDDFIEIKLNGHVIYVGPYGGDYINVQENEVEEERERTVREAIFNRRGRIIGHRDVKQKYKEKIKRTEVYNGREYKPCELSTNWDSNVNLANVNVDLRPYLKDGENILEMKIIVSGAGEGWLKIEARQQCCANDEWESNWEEVCE